MSQVPTSTEQTEQSCGASVCSLRVCFPHTRPWPPWAFVLRVGVTRESFSLWGFKIHATQNTFHLVFNVGEPKAAFYVTLGAVTSKCKNWWPSRLKNVGENYPWKHAHPHTCTHTHTRVEKYKVTLSWGTPSGTYHITCHINILAVESLVGGSHFSLIFLYCLSLQLLSPSTGTPGLSSVIASIMTRCRQRSAVQPPVPAPAPARTAGCQGDADVRGSRDLLKCCNLIISMAFCKMREGGFQAATAPSSGNISSLLCVWFSPSSFWCFLSWGFQENAIPRDFEPWVGTACHLPDSG